MTTPMEHAREALQNGPLDQLAKAIYRINRDNGWFDDSGAPRCLSDEFMLIGGELFEAHEEQRKGKSGSERYYTYTMKGADVGTYNMEFGDGKTTITERRTGRVVDPQELPARIRKPEGIPSEMADILIRVLDFCYRYQIDLEEVVLEKLAYNETRGYKHGGKKL